MLIVGVDPGLKGAIAWLDVDAGGSVRTATAEVMPTKLLANGRPWYDVEELAALIRRDRPARAFVERLHPLPMKFRRKGSDEEVEGGGVIANYNRGAATWLWIGMLEGLGIEYELVLPQVWQRAMLEGIPGADTKAKSVWLAQRVFPSCSLLATPRSRKPHDGLADALCIAEYGRRILAGDRGRQRGLLEVGA